MSTASVEITSGDVAFLLPYLDDRIAEHQELVDWLDDPADQYDSMVAEMETESLQRLRALLALLTESR